MLSTEVISDKYVLTKLSHVQKSMELPMMEEYWVYSLENANKYKKPIVCLVFEFLKLNQLQAQKKTLFHPYLWKKKTN